jgi:hypothetical protein
MATDGSAAPEREPAAAAPASAPDEPAAPPRRARWVTWLNAVCLALGVVLLAGLVFKLDLQQVGAKLRLVGWAFLGVFASHVVGLAVTAAGWQCMVDPARSRARYRDFLAAFWAGWSINALTPGAQLGAVLRMTILRGKVESGELIASLVTLTFFSYASTMALTLLAPLLCLALLDLPARTVLLVFGIALLFCVPMLLIYLFLRRGAAAATIRIVRKVPFVRFKDPERVVERAQAIDRSILTFRQQRPRLFLSAVLWIAAARVCQVLEYAVLLPVLAPGHGLLWIGGVALLTQASSQLLAWALTFVPSQVGVAEAGTTLLFKLLALDPVVGLTIEITRRVRTVIGVTIGLLIGWAVGVRGRPG